MLSSHCANLETIVPQRLQHVMLLNPLEYLNFRGVACFIFGFPLGPRPNAVEASFLHPTDKNPGKKFALW